MKVSASRRQVGRLREVRRVGGEGCALLCLQGLARSGGEVGVLRGDHGLAGLGQPARWVARVR